MANIDVRDEDETYELCYRINQDYAGTDGKNLLDNIHRYGIIIFWVLP